MSNVAYPSILPAEESVCIVGFPTPLRGPEIAENISLQLSSTCSGFCTPWTLRPHGKTPCSIALPASPFPTTSSPHRASAMSPSVPRSPFQPLFCCMSTPTQLLKWLIPSNPGLFADPPACLCCTPCNWRMLHSHNIQLGTHQVIFTR